MSPKPLSPADLAKSGSEHANQVAYFCFLSQNFNEYPCLKLAYAIPNGGERDSNQKTAMIRRAQLKAEGVKPGVPDICLPISVGTKHGLYVELKIGKNKPTDEQYKYMAELKNQGFVAEWVIGWEAAANLTLAYLRGEFQ
jgi:hypothetical protein